MYAACERETVVPKTIRFSGPTTRSAFHPQATVGSRPIADTGPLSDILGMDRYLEPGTEVRLINHGDGSWEDGVVVHCWLSDEIKAHDCYVAFFGESIPAGQPAAKPYVLRYASTSLTVLEE